MIQHTYVVVTNLDLRDDGCERDAVSAASGLGEDNNIVFVVYYTHLLYDGGGGF